MSPPGSLPDSIADREALFTPGAMESRSDFPSIDSAIEASSTPVAPVAPITSTVLQVASTTSSAPEIVSLGYPVESVLSASVPTVYQSPAADSDSGSNPDNSLGPIACRPESRYIECRNSRRPSPPNMPYGRREPAPYASVSSDTRGRSPLAVTERQHTPYGGSNGMYAEQSAPSVQEREPAPYTRSYMPESVRPRSQAPVPHYLSGTSTALRNLLTRGREPAPEARSHAPQPTLGVREPVSYDGSRAPRPLQTMRTREPAPYVRSRAPTPPPTLSVREPAPYARSNNPSPAEPTPPSRESFADATQQYLDRVRYEADPYPVRPLAGGHYLLDLPLPNSFLYHGGIGFDDGNAAFPVPRPGSQFARAGRGNSHIDFPPLFPPAPPSSSQYIYGSEGWRSEQNRTGANGFFTYLGRIRNGDNAHGNAPRGLYTLPERIPARVAVPDPVTAAEHTVTATIDPPAVTSTPAEEELCSICMDPITASTRGQLQPCNHSYHFDCIMQWLDTQHLVRPFPVLACPLCRQEILHARHAFNEAGTECSITRVDHIYLVHRVQTGVNLVDDVPQFQFPTARSRMDDNQRLHRHDNGNFIPLEVRPTRRRRGSIPMRPAYVRFGETVEEADERIARELQLELNRGEGWRDISAGNDAARGEI